jgi:hypothetical protein
MGMVFAAIGLPATQKLVLLALAWFAEDDGTSVYPSVETITERSGASERTVRLTMKELRAGKLLREVRKAHQHHATEYAINLELLASLRGATDAPLPEDTGRGEAGREQKQPASGAEIAPLENPGVQNLPPRGAEIAPGVQISSSRGAGSAPNQSLNSHLNPSIEKEDPIPEKDRRVITKFKAKIGSQVTIEDIRVLVELCAAHSEPAIDQAIDWCAARKMTIGKALSSMTTALPNWNIQEHGAKSGQPAPPRADLDPDLEFIRLNPKAPVVLIEGARARLREKGLLQ